MKFSVVQNDFVTKWLFSNIPEIRIEIEESSDPSKEIGLIQIPRNETETEKVDQDLDHNRNHDQLIGLRSNCDMITLKISNDRKNGLIDSKIGIVRMFANFFSFSFLTSPNWDDFRFVTHSNPASTYPNVKIGYKIYA